MFLFETMEKLGFSQKFINFIQILYKNNKSSIINNGYLPSPINLYRGLRQGCPLSLPLYVVQSEVTTINTNNNENIVRHKDSKQNKSKSASMWTILIF